MLQLVKKFVRSAPILSYLYKKRLERIHFAEMEQKEKNLKEWENLFKEGEDKIVYKLDPEIRLYLFRHSILSKLIYEGNFEVNEINFVKSHLKPGEIFIDIGSNIGLFSMIGSQKVGSHGKVIAFEPSPTTFERLQLNTTLAVYDNIEIRNLGLSNSNSKLILNISGGGYDAWDTFGTVEEEKRTGQVEVEVSTLDDQLTGVDKTKISLIKIDVEGWEKFVLLGAQTFLQQFSPALLIEFTGRNTKAAGYEASEIYDLLAAWGYEWFAFKNNRLIPSQRKLSYSDENLIAIKKSS